MYYGDGLRLDLLRKAGAEDAELILYCADDASVTAEQVEPIIKAFPQAKFYARAYDRMQVMALDGAGLAGTVREVYESAIAMGIMALQALECTSDEVRDIERAYRLTDMERLTRQIAENDVRAGQELRFLPGSDGQTVQDVFDREHIRTKKAETKGLLNDGECG